jgi:hypothetical protein
MALKSSKLKKSPMSPPTCAQLSSSNVLPSWRAKPVKNGIASRRCWQPRDGWRQPIAHSLPSTVSHTPHG